MCTTYNRKLADSFDFIGENENISKLSGDFGHDLQLLVDDVFRQHPQATVWCQDQPVRRDELQGLLDPGLHLLLSLHPSPGHGDTAQDHLHN